eukprot:2935919-Rhodomonas_salina.2
MARCLQRRIAVCSTAMGCVPINRCPCQYCDSCMTLRRLSIPPGTLQREIKEKKNTASNPNGLCTARLRAQSNAFPVVTGTRSMVGTLRYRAPEMLRGETYGASVDW